MDIWAWGLCEGKQSASRASDPLEGTCEALRVVGGTSNEAPNISNFQNRESQITYWLLQRLE